MSLLRERIAHLIRTAENQGWQTIVAPIDFMRAAFLDAPAGMEQRLRQRALQLQAAAPAPGDVPADPSALGADDRALLDDAADMIAALSAPLPEETVDTRDRLRLIDLIDLIDHALLYLPAGAVRTRAQAMRITLWKELTGFGQAMEGPAVEGIAENGIPSVGGTEPSAATASESMAPWGVRPEDASGPFETTASVDAVASLLRELIASAEAVGSITDEDVFATAEQIDQLYAYDIERLKHERTNAKQFERIMINQWLEAHEKSIEAERRAIRAKQREQEAVERCARIAEEAVELPPDARAIRLAVVAVQRHIAAAIRARGMSA